MNFKPFAAGLALLGMVAPASAAGFDADAQVQNSTNSQQNSGSVTLAPSGGTQVNNNVNNAYSSTYSFGPGINCPTPSFAVNAFGGLGESGSQQSTSYGGSISYIMPIGGDIGNACRDHVKEITKQRQLDTKVNMINVCARFAQQGVTIDTAQFPEFKVCEGVTVAGRQAVGVNPQPVFTAPSTAIPVVPVSKR